MRISLWLLACSLIGCASTAAETVSESEVIASGTLVFRSSNACEGTDFVVVNASTDCRQISGRAASAKIDGQCQDIADTWAEDACSQYKGGVAALLFRSSNACEGTDFAVVNSSTDCRQISGRAASAKINGQCQDIADTWAEDACRQYKGGAGTLLFRSSNACQGTDFVVVNASTDCRQISGRAASAKINGQCQDIADTWAEDACSQYKGEAGTLVFRSSNACEGTDFVVVNAATDCRQISGRAASVKVDGQCQDIADTWAEDACRQHKGGPGTLVFRSSNTCEGTDFVVANASTDCRQISGRAASVKVDGQCQDIADTWAEDACSQYKSGVKALLFRSSNACEGTDFVVVNASTDCRQVSGRAASVKVDGQCQDIADTWAEDACRQHQ